MNPYTWQFFAVVAAGWILSTYVTGKVILPALKKANLPPR